MSASDRSRSGPTILAVILLVLHFLLRPLLVDWSVGPDLLAGGLLLAALELRAGVAAVIGFAVGVLEAAMAGSGLGTLAIVYAVAGYAGARSWDLMFADARLFLPVYLTLGCWVLQLAPAGFASASGLTWGLALVRGPASALLTAALCWPLARAAAGARVV